MECVQLVVIAAQERQPLILISTVVVLVMVDPNVITVWPVDRILKMVYAQQAVAAIQVVQYPLMVARPIIQHAHQEDIVIVQLLMVITPVMVTVRRVIVASPVMNLLQAENMAHSGERQRHLMETMMNIVDAREGQARYVIDPQKMVQLVTRILKLVYVEIACVTLIWSHSIVVIHVPLQISQMQIFMQAALLHPLMDGPVIPVSAILMDTLQMVSALMVRQTRVIQVVM